MKRALAVIGDAANVNTWSGTPHFLFEEARRQDFLHIALNLDPKPLRYRRGLWHASNLLRGRRLRGFQYTDLFQRRITEQLTDQVIGEDQIEIVSHSSLLPHRTLERCPEFEWNYYLDAPLKALFETHGMLGWLEESTVQRAIDRERELLNQAKRVVGMASWVVEYVRDHYGVPSKKLHVVHSAANLPEKDVQALLRDRGPRVAPERFDSGRPFRIGFTGKDWRRKGLARLVDAADELRRRGYCVEVLVMGHLPRAYRSHPLVRTAGFVNKSSEIRKFLEVLDRYDIGCFPSHQEPMGIAPFECLRLGIPAICTAVGGWAEACPTTQGAGILVPADVDGAGLADHIEPLIAEPERLQAMSTAAWRIKEHYSWERAVREMEQVWATTA
jgi:glycosyltransferase involved in cell wall biosynthesis